jgi:uncharacterized phage protein (TIGR02220 family)
MDNKKSYYAIIPANVRYDERLTPNAKLLYGEITALCNEKGYCWANNEYFASLYCVSKVSVSKWIQSLIEFGYIESKLNYVEGSKQIFNRYLSLVGYPIKENFNTPIKEKFNDNNTVINNTINNTNNNIVDFDELLNFINKSFGRNFKLINNSVKKSLNARIKDGYSKNDIKNCIDNLRINSFHKENGYQYCTPEFISRAQTMEKYSTKSNVINKEIVASTANAPHLNL